MNDDSKPKKVQRIKMRLYKHPVKLDGTLTAFAADGSSFIVEFDGPFPTTTFYRYRSGDAIVVDMPLEHGEATEGANLWEVL